MQLRDCLKTQQAILMEGALGERLRREAHLSFDEHVAMAGLVYDVRGNRALSGLWKEYIDIARENALPFLATTPTRRANRDRIGRSRFSERIIEDNVRFLQGIQRESGIEMAVGALVGCRGDAYTAEGALDEQEAFSFHLWTAERFKKAGAEFLFAGIMPALPEAAGLAKAASAAGIPCILSFTVLRSGHLPDGTALSEAIRYIEDHTPTPPLCYMSNCVHPINLYAALSQPFNRTAEVRTRFQGIQANTSPLPYAELDGVRELQGADPKALAQDMLRLRQLADIRIWGGCCGTDGRHLSSIAQCLRRKEGNHE